MRDRMILYRLGGLAAIGLILAAGSRIMQAESADPEEISRLLVDAKSHAILLEDDAAALDSYTRSKLSWQTHSSQLTQIRDHINELAQINSKLSELRATGAPWQQQAIDQIDPLLRDMASLIRSTINHLNDSQSRIHMKSYRDYAHANYELANRTAEMIRDFVEYDEAKAKAEALEAKLALREAVKAE